MTRKLIHLSVPALALFVSVMAGPGYAQSNKVRVSGLQDVNFGTLPSSSDAISSQSLCVFVGTATSTYSVSAMGSGNGGAFSLTGSGSDLSIDVMWSEVASQQSGDILVSSVPSRIYTSSASHQRCNRAPIATASLVIRARETEISRASAGTYSGAITLIISPS